MMRARADCMFANAHRDPKKHPRPYEVADFLPNSRPKTVKEQVIEVFSRFRRKPSG